MLESKQKVIKGLNIACIVLAGLAFAACLIFGIVASADVNSFIQSDEPTQLAQGINNKAQDIKNGAQEMQQEIQKKESEISKNKDEKNKSSSEQSEQDNQATADSNEQTPPDKPSGEKSGDMNPPDMPEGMQELEGLDDSVLGKLFNGQGITTDDIASFCNHSLSAMWGIIAGELVFLVLMLISSILVLVRHKKKEKANFTLGWTIVGAAAALLSGMIISLILYIIALVMVCGIRKIVKLENNAQSNVVIQGAGNMQGVNVQGNVNTQYSNVQGTHNAQYPHVQSEVNSQGSNVQSAGNNHITQNTTVSGSQIPENQNVAAGQTPLTQGSVQTGDAPGASVKKTESSTVSSEEPKTQIPLSGVPAPSVPKPHGSATDNQETKDSEAKNN